MTRTSLQPGGLARLTVLCLPVAAALVLPSAAIAASGGSTVRATVGGDGSVKSVKVYAPGGTASDFNGTLPLKLSISRTVSGSTSTYHYRVENTYSKQQTVTYTDTAGKSHSTTAELQLPLVAQLGIQLPSTFKDVSAPAGVVQTDPDGVNRVLFSMVLFSPLGAPTQDVTFTATGSGSPTAELSATAVNPASTAGLSQASQDANASGQQDDFWSSFASGGNTGLTQLADGVGKMVAGLDQLDPGTHQLADGLKAAGDGATKLDAGTKSAFDGSKQLASGSKTASDGAAQLATGAKSAYGGAQQLDSGAKTAFDGSKALATGSKSAADGATSLSTGLGTISTGQSQLNDGLTLLAGGLGQLDDKTPGKGLQAAVDGVTAIESGVQQLLVGLQGPGGTYLSPTPIDLTTTPPTLSILLGISHPAGTLGGTDPGGGEEVLKAINTGLQNIATALSGVAAAESDAGLKTTLNTLVAQLQGISTPATGSLSQVIFGIDHAAGTLGASDAGGLLQGIQQVTLGLSHPVGAAGPTDLGGVDQGLLALLSPTSGLPFAVSAVDQLTAGANTALAGSTELKAGSASAFTGSQTLAAGAGQVASGASALSAGVGQISGGLDELTPGLGKISGGLGDLSPGLVKIAVGLGSLSSGLGELSAGQHQVAAGLPAAVSGAAQIAAGTDQLKAGAVAVHDGLLAVQSGAVGPLLTQITQGSQNAKKQLAILDAAGALAAQAPGGAGTAYVLSQSPKGFRLAASTSSSGGSNTGRNIGIGLGGLVALVIAVTAGFALGRRSSVSA